MSVPSLSSGFPGSDVTPPPVKAAACLAALAASAPALLGPVAPGTITLIRGARGVGKSWLALAVARAIAGGASFLGWSARLAPVVYVESAMTEAALGQRLRVLGPVPEALHIARAFPLGAGPAGDATRAALAPGKVIVLDGLALLVNRDGGRAGPRWRAMGEALCALREAGHALVLVEHGRRAVIEDLADTVLVLKPRSGEADVTFSVAATSRHALRREDRRFEVDLALADAAVWRRHDAPDPALAAVAAQAMQKVTVRAGAAATGLPIATYWRRLQTAKAEGLVDGTPPETDETAPACKPRGPDEAGPALARLSDGVLHRTLDKRLAARRKGRTSAPRPGPAMLAEVADADILAELAHRHPQRAARLRAQFAPLAPAA